MSQSIFALYDGDGRIDIVVKNTPSRTSAEVEADYTGYTAITCAGTVKASTHYVTGGTVTAKAAVTASWDKTSITANGTDTAALTGLPTTCTIYVDGDAGTAVTDGAFNFTATDEGEYSIILDEPGYVKTEWTIDAS